ncbi:hypothetical protein [Saccharothrix syringae]|uniref:Uncharacterized protein n=1 Tax=Saccharothrix syringae TaxID=103733 RepID=A0A5Q0H1V7_SACSY|nr:hypothetical protein [Saccharothrix syringae]QFZ19844.1 hypothetical protein EKG83_22590 [Saccharothrix syringae]
MPYGPDRRAFGEAYDQGRNLTTDGPMAFIRDTEVDRMHIGDRHYHFATGGTGRRWGSVRDEERTQVRARYVRVAGFEDMRSTLGDRRVLLLCGEPGSGRFTTAVRLLDELVPGQICRFEAGQALASLTEGDFERGHGYVLEVAGEVGGPTGEAELDKLRDLTDRCGSWLVVTAEPDGLAGRRLGGYAAPHPAPDHRQVLRSHLAQEVRGGDRDVRDLLGELAGTPRLQKALGPAPRPAEAAEMARLLARHGRREITLEEVENEAALLVREQVLEWFASLPGLRGAALRDALDLAAFRISLAVLNRSPYHMVTEAGRDLAERFGKGLKDASTSPSPFTDDQRNRLPGSRAEITDGRLSFGRISLPTGLAHYSDDRLPVVLLSHVWKNHHNLRAAMVGWLKALSKDARPMIWVRAAQATGLFCSLDFHFTFQSMIRPGATANGGKCKQRRLFAAVALDQAARDDRVAEAVDERLKYWRRHGSYAERWTAAAALGYDLGRRSIEVTFEELRVLGTPSERHLALDWLADLSLVSDLVQTSGYSVANLFAFGEVEPVLAKLAEWAVDERQSVRNLAWWAMLFMISMHGYDLNHLRMSAGRSKRPTARTRERWPLLLALQDEQPHLTARIAHLLRWGLRGRRADYVAKYLFGPWMRAAGQEDECMRALVAFVPHLVHDEFDARRLCHLINRLRHDWSDPLADNAAGLLESAVRLHRPDTREEAS